MKPRTDKATMTELLREAIGDCGESMYAIGKGAGVNKAIIMRFRRGSQSLRLDMADRLAAYLGIECRWTRRPKG